MKHNDISREYRDTLEKLGITCDDSWDDPIFCFARQYNGPDQYLSQYIMQDIYNRRDNNEHNSRN